MGWSLTGRTVAERCWGDAWIEPGRSDAGETHGRSDSGELRRLDKNQGECWTPQPNQRSTFDQKTILGKSAFYQTHFRAKGGRGAFWRGRLSREPKPDQKYIFGQNQLSPLPRRKLQCFHTMLLAGKRRNSAFFLAARFLITKSSWSCARQNRPTL